MTSVQIGRTGKLSEGQQEGDFTFKQTVSPNKVFQVAPVVKNPPANAGDAGDVDLIPESGSSPGEGNGDPLQCSCLGNPMDRGAWRATVHGVTESDTTE